MIKYMVEFTIQDASLVSKENPVGEERVTQFFLDESRAIRFANVVDNAYLVARDSTITSYTGD